jgi:hypothetical protein
MSILETGERNNVINLGQMRQFARLQFHFLLDVGMNAVQVANDTSKTQTIVDNALNSLLMVSIGIVLDRMEPKYTKNQLTFRGWQTREATRSALELFPNNLAFDKCLSATQTFISVITTNHYIPLRARRLLSVR